MPPQAAIAARAGRGRRSKVADFLCAMVSSWGHIGRQAYDAAGGLTAARAAPNVVLLDIAMPGVDGYQLRSNCAGRPT